MSIKGLIAGPRRKAFEGFCQVVKTDRAFANSRLGIRWWDVDGGSPPSPSADQMPCIMLRYIGGEVARQSVRGTAGPLGAITSLYAPSISVDIWVAGDDPSDATDLGDAIEAALFPATIEGKQSIFARLQSFGIVDVQLAAEVAPRGPEDFAGQFVHASGSYQLTLALTDIPEQE